MLMIGDLLGLSLQPAVMIDTSGHQHQSCGHLGHLDTGQLDTGRSAGGREQSVYWCQLP